MQKVDSQQNFTLYNTYESSEIFDYSKNYKFRVHLEYSLYWSAQIRIRGTWKQEQ
ncbi:unnamed protein product [Paramecium primaurelia]|uniref:Uncharacterized protein n=1 Tax=Paramecium primaurelia TaxID=5886 RepID=A0A8S1LTW5_PARPR|nr:unnamed protein product [Paramecium primaurelia]